MVVDVYGFRCLHKLRSGPRRRNPRLSRSYFVENRERGKTFRQMWFHGRRHDISHDDTLHNATQYYATWYSSTQQNATQYNATLQDTSQQNATQQLNAT
jgi:hypothetical protein